MPAISQRHAFPDYPGSGSMGCRDVSFLFLLSFGNWIDRCKQWRSITRFDYRFCFFLGTRVVEIYLENDYNFPLGENAYSATKSDHRVDHRCPRFSPARNNTRSPSPLSTNERNIAREKVREKEERGNYYYYYCYLEKLPGNSTRVKGKKGEFFLFYKILVNNCGAIARGAKKKKATHDSR